MTKIDHIVFDIGKVLIRYDAETPFRLLIPDAEERQHFLTQICSHQWNIEQDRGRPWAEAEAELIELHPDKELQIRAFRRDWHHMVGPEISGSVAIMRQFIADGHDVTLLTNFASDTFRESQERWPFLSETRGVTVSGDVKLIKPDPAIYKLHAETFELNPEKTLFIDDSLPNILAAHSCGWHAVQFITPEKLIEDLGEFGLWVKPHEMPEEMTGLMAEAL
jgi:2-haloacid dehalogenase